MLYTAGEIILFLVASAVIGVLIGYFTWGRSPSSATAEVTTLQRQLAATRKRAAAAESDVTKRGDALKEAQVQFDAQQARIQQLESRDPAAEDGESGPDDADS